MATWVRAHTRTGAIGPGPSGGMADTTDSKSVARKGVRVQIPPRALLTRRFTKVRSGAADSQSVFDRRGVRAGLGRDDLLGGGGRGRLVARAHRRRVRGGRGYDLVDGCVHRLELRTLAG